MRFLAESRTLRPMNAAVDKGPTNPAARAHLEAHLTTMQSANHVPDDLEVRTMSPTWEIRHSGRADEAFTVRGYAAVFNQPSHDLGGFIERIDPSAFDAILATSPDVHFVWDHDTRYVGARTTNGTLELRADAIGLYIDARVGAYSWAKDLRLALERGDISQGSFKFHVGEDSWDVGDEDQVLRTVNAVDGLYDVTVTAQGAYPQTSLAAARSLAVARGSSAPAEATLVAPEEGELSSQQGDTDPELARRREDLKARVTLRRNELAELAERLGRL